MTATHAFLDATLRRSLLLLVAPLRAAAWLIAGEAELELAHDARTLRQEASELAEAR